MTRSWRRRSWRFQAYLYQNPSYFLVFTHGEGGECNVPDGCSPDVAAIRGKEMQQAAQLYHAELRHEYYYNAHLPLESFPKRHEMAATWLSQGDPARVIAEVIRKFRPDLLLTLAPEFGYTGHIEHQFASRFAMAGIRLAAEPAFSLERSPHRVCTHLLPAEQVLVHEALGKGI